MKRLSIDRSGGQTQNFKQRIKLFARNLLTVVMLSCIAFLCETKENVVLHDVDILFLKIVAEMLFCGPLTRIATRGRRRFIGSNRQSIMRNASSLKHSWKP